MAFGGEYTPLAFAEARPCSLKSLFESPESTWRGFDAMGSFSGLTPFTSAASAASGLAGAAYEGLLGEGQGDKGALHDASAATERARSMATSLAEMLIFARPFSGFLMFHCTYTTTIQQLENVKVIGGYTVLYATSCYSSCILILGVVKCASV